MIFKTSHIKKKKSLKKEKPSIRGHILYDFTYVKYANR